MNLSKQNYVGMFLIPLVSIVLGFEIVSAQQSLQDPDLQDRIESLQEADAFNFLEEPIIVPLESIDEIQEQYVQLGNTYTGPAFGILIEDFHAIFGQELENYLIGHDLDPFDGWNIAVYHEIFGIPLDYNVAVNQLSYTLIAHSFLLDKLPQLSAYDIDWLILSKGDDSEISGKGFIAKGFVTVAYAELSRTSAPNEIVATVPLSPKYWTGSFGVIGDQDSNYILLGSGPGALIAPFSEIIPFALYEASTRPSNGFSESEKSISLEAISESISFVLAHELLETLGIWWGPTLLKENFNETTKGLSIYQHVKAGVVLAEANGYLATLELYLQNPPSYMEALSQSNNN